MTAEKRIFISFQDILAIQFACKNCNARFGYRIDSWKEIPNRCANCGNKWFTNGGFDEKELFKLQEMLRRFHAHQDPKFAISFEIEANN